MTPWDWGALALFFVSWLGYGLLLPVLAGKGHFLNDDMLAVRQAWMNQMAVRELRLVDSQLMGHSINSASFFASANLLLIAAVAGVLFGGEAALRGVASVGADIGGAQTASLELLEAKLGLVTLCLARGLLDFIWAIRQMNYTLALIGATPESETSSLDRAAYAAATGAVLNPAMVAFNSGVRAYYFALAATAWLFGPLWLALGAAAAFSLLLWRQKGSPAARAISRAREMLDESQ
ncbi:MAG: putative membrane protein [Brevundimonas sp.]|jgi:uncharacterized membrane protein|uniref:DUF599 domain-containing protein n=1 Tax=Brevundimonas sp. TaxID=1871086 RepID=UPI0039E2B14B